MGAGRGRSAADHVQALRRWDLGGPLAMNDDIVLIQEKEAGAPPHATAQGVGFGLYPKLDKKMSDIAGRPIYNDVLYVKIITPGENKTVFLGPATADHKRRFPLAYRVYQDGEGAHLKGTPLAHWPIMTRGQVLSFKALGIHTVEAMAAVNDDNLDALGYGGRELRTRAQA